MVNLLMRTNLCDCYKFLFSVETPLESTNLLTESVACQEDVSGKINRISLRLCS